MRKESARIYLNSATSLENSAVSRLVTAKRAAKQPFSFRHANNPLSKTVSKTRHSRKAKSGTPWQHWPFSSQPSWLRHDMRPKYRICTAPAMLFAKCHYSSTVADGDVVGLIFCLIPKVFVVPGQG